MNAKTILYDAIKDFPEIACRPAPTNTKNLGPPVGASLLANRCCQRASPQSNIRRQASSYKYKKPGAPLYEPACWRQVSSQTSATSY